MKQMMKQKRYITLFALIVAMMLLLTACHNDVAADASASQRTDDPILIGNVGVAPNELTRADASDVYNVSLPSGKEIGIYLYSEGTTDFSGQHPYTDGDKYKTWVYQTAGTPYAVTGGKYKSSLALVSHTKSPNFPKKTNTELVDQVTLFGMFPYDKTLTPDKTDYTFTVPLSQTASAADQAAITAADLLTTNGLVTYTKVQCEAQAAIDLVLHHRMAKLRVVFSPKANGDLTQANMPTKFDVIGVNRTVTVNPKAGTVTTSTATADKTTTDAPLKGVTSQAFFIPPQSLAAGATLLKFNVLGSDNFRGIQGASFAVPTGGVNLQAGHEYHINVTVDVDFITMTGTITPWDSEGGEIKYENYTDSVR